MGLGTGGSFSGGGLIDQVHQAPEMDAAVVAQTHLTGAACRVSVSASLRVEMLQARSSQLRIPAQRWKTTVCNIWTELLDV